MTVATRRRRDRIWALPPAMISLLVMTPVAAVLLGLFDAGGDAWTHIANELLPTYVSNTIVLLLGVLVGTFVIGSGSAWLVSAYDFPGRKIFEWALVLPLAFPTYVMGYLFLDIMGYGGPIFGFLKSQFNLAASQYPNMQTGLGLILVMSLSFYPYVYLLSRNAFRTHGSRALEAARSLGHGPSSAFVRCVLPMSRPWILGGLLLVAMETMADFGTVSVFNFDTFTTGIYKAWYSFFSLASAAKLAALLLVAAMSLLFGEKWLRRKQRFYSVTPTEAPPPRRRLAGGRGWSAAFLLAGLLSVNFVIPLLHLLRWSIFGLAEESQINYWPLVRNTFIVGLTAAALLSVTTLFLAYAVRVRNTRPMRVLASLCTIGYALPGTVLAVGVFLALNQVDILLDGLWQKWFGQAPAVLLTGTLTAMLFGYGVRFFAIAHRPVSAGLERIRPTMDESARSLGHGTWSILRTIHLPLLRPGLLTAALMVLIEVMKEMPITLMTRPFGWDTLAVRIFELTSEGLYERAAIPSLLLVIAGLVPVLFLTRFADTHGES